MKEIYDEDNSPNKEDATTFFKYIHIRSQLDPQAPFYTADIHEIDQLARKDIYGDMNYDFGMNSLINGNDNADEVLKKYIEAYSSPENRVILSFNKKIDQFKKLIDDTNPEIKHNAAKNTYTSNVTLLIKLMTEIEEVITARDRLAQIAKKEDVGKGKVRAGAKPSLLEAKHKKGK